jgi:WD40 repeat protein
MGPETIALAKSMLQHSSAGLVNLVNGRLASESAPAVETSPANDEGSPSSTNHKEGPFALLVVVDQFEEIFRFASNTSPEEASHFVQLLIEAVRAGREGVPLYLALAMRSDFQGDCAVFPGLPELINEAQYLVPRMNLRQREAAIVRPAATEHRQIARPLLDRLLDDMGENPDQLPVLQHALQRTWEAWQRRTGGEGEIALEDYLAPDVGGMAGAIEKHAEEAFASLDSSQQRLAGALFRCITERAEDRRPVRRPLPLGTIATIAGVSMEEIIPVVDAFRTQQRTFLTPPEGVALEPQTIVDISHESLIRNWPRLARWAKLESAAAGELRRLRESSRGFLEKTQDPMDQLELSRVDRWRKGAFAGEAQAAAQIMPSEEWARLYLGDDAPEAFRNTQLYISESRKLLRISQLREQVTHALVGFLVILLIATGVYVGIQRYRAVQEKQVDAARAAREKEADAQRRLEVISAFGLAADGLAPPIVSNAKSALSEAEQQTEKLTAAIIEAAHAAPPDQGTVDELTAARQDAEQAAEAMQTLAKSMESAANITNDLRLSQTAAQLAVVALEVRARRDALLKSEAARKAIEASVEARLAHAEAALGALFNASPLDPAMVQAKNKEDIPAATADVSAIVAIGNAAEALGFSDADFDKLAARAAALMQTLLAIQSLKVAGAPEIASRKTDSAVPLKHEAKVNRVRFLRDGKRIASAGDDKNVTFWDATGQQLRQFPTSSPINDIAFSDKAIALAIASNGSSVRILRLGNFNQIKDDTFEQHSDSITDVEFSHGGEQVASASADRTVRVFDSRSLAQRYFTSPRLPGIVTAVAFHPGDNLVVSGCDDGGVRLHTIDEPAVQLLGKFGAPARRPEFSPDGKFVLAASGDKTARIWPIVSPRELVNLPHPAPVNHATFRPVVKEGACTFVTCATNGELRLVHVTDMTNRNPVVEEKVLEPHHPGSAVFATWTEDGNWLATVGGGEVLIWKWEESKLVIRLRLLELNAATSRAEFTSDSKLLVTYGGDNIAYLWNLAEILNP